MNKNESIVRYCIFWNTIGNELHSIVLSFYSKITNNDSILATEERTYLYPRFSRHALVLSFLFTSFHVLKYDTKLYLLRRDQKLFVLDVIQAISFYGTFANTSINDQEKTGDVH